MFACLYVPTAPAMRGVSASAGDSPDVSVLLDIARTASPRVAVHSSRQILIDIEGLERLVGDPRAIGDHLRQAAADRGMAPVHVAVAGTCTAAMLLAAARAGVTVVAAGEEAAALAPLPLRTLTVLAQEESVVSSQYSVASRKPEGRRQKTEGSVLNSGPSRLPPSPNGLPAGSGEAGWLLATSSAFCLLSSDFWPRPSS